MTKDDSFRTICSDHNRHNLDMLWWGNADIYLSDNESYIVAQEQML